MYKFYFVRYNVKNRLKQGIIDLLSVSDKREVGSSSLLEPTNDNRLRLSFLFCLAFRY